MATLVTELGQENDVFLTIFFVHFNVSPDIFQTWLCYVRIFQEHLASVIHSQ